ncbi:hypothetical protein F2P79_000039 [Pimephales promelas]|nr:hypothetical protein F2P79_000039 [Pimephales promelas]
MACNMSFLEDFFFHLSYRSFLILPSLPRGVERFRAHQQEEDPSGVLLQNGHICLGNQKHFGCFFECNLYSHLLGVFYNYV